MPLYLRGIGGRLNFDPFYIHGLSSDDEGNGAATGPVSPLYNGPASPTSPSYTPTNDDDRFASDGGSEQSRGHGRHDRIVHAPSGVRRTGYSVPCGCAAWCASGPRHNRAPPKVDPSIWRTASMSTWPVLMMRLRICVRARVHGTCTRARSEMTCTLIASDQSV
jgi:hypothetical protein